ncbi:MAG: NADH/ubiquinone/plastoquinone (complex I) [Spirochaetes bacterium]|nr:MAG: NADH/ubiquinone/plastoquinone (complex I) [Spirochaetota bacterium]
MEIFVPLYVAIPLGCAFIGSIIGIFSKAFSRLFTSLVLAFMAGLSVYLILLQKFPIVYTVGGWKAFNRVPIGIYMVMDGLSVYLVTIVNVIGFLSAFYSISYIKRFTGENYYYSLFSLMIAGMNGVILSGDLFNLYVFLEIAAISSYALVAFGIEKEQLEASFKYQVLGGISSLFILLSIGLIYWYTSTLNIADISRVLSHKSFPKTIVFVEIILLSAFGLKAAMIPFHAWLPDAHSSAPSPISSMLSGVLIKAIGAYVIMRLFFNLFAISYSIAYVITVIGTISMVVGVLLAIGQWDIKRLLAYHSISQMGYVILGIGIGMLVISKNGNMDIASLAIAGGLFHLFNHAVFKGLLFLNAGAVEYVTGIRDMKRLGGLAGGMPITASTSMSASMSISGIPPFNGFFSKLIIIIASAKAGYYVLSILAVFVSMITLASFLKVQRFTFFNNSGEKWSERGITIKEVPFPMCFSMIFLAVLCIVLSLMVFPSVRDVVLMPAVNVLLKSSVYSTNILGY